MHHWRQARQRNYTEFYDGMGEPASIDPSEIDGGAPEPVVWIGASVDASDGASDGATNASTLDARLVAFFHGLKRGGDESSSDEMDEDSALYIGADEDDEIDDVVDDAVDDVIDTTDTTLDDAIDDAIDDDNPFDIAIAAADNSLIDDEKSPADILAECGDSH